MNITITRLAREKLAKAFSELRYQNPALRIRFAGFGWRGPRLGLALEELDDASSHTEKNEEITIVTKQRVRDYLENFPSITVDYKESWFNSGFVIEWAGACWYKHAVMEHAHKYDVRRK